MPAISKTRCLAIARAAVGPIHDASFSAPRFSARPDGPREQVQCNDFYRARAARTARVAEVAAVLWAESRGVHQTEVFEAMARLSSIYRTAVPSFFDAILQELRK